MKLSFVNENLSADKKIAYPRNSTPFQLNSLSGVLQHFCYKRFLETRASRTPEYWFVVEHEASTDFSINCFSIFSESNTPLPLIGTMQNSSQELGLQIPPDSYEIAILTTAKNFKTLYNDESMKYSVEIEAILILVNGNWYVISEVEQIQKFLSNTNFLKKSYSASESKPSVKLQLPNYYLTIMQALRLLKSYASSDDNIDSYANICETTKSIQLTGYPSTKPAAFKPDTHAFLETNKSTISIQSGFVCAYYYTGVATANEHVIAYINNHWFLLRGDDAKRFMLSINDEARNERLKKSLPTLTVTEVKQLTETISKKVANLIYENSDFTVSAKFIIANCSFRLIATEVDAETLMRKNQGSLSGEDVKTFEIPNSAESYFIRVELSNEETSKSIIFAYINGAYYEVLNRIEELESHNDYNSSSSVYTFWSSN